jgi:hypothetical protein
MDQLPTELLCLICQYLWPVCPQGLDAMALSCKAWRAGVESFLRLARWKQTLEALRLKSKLGRKCAPVGPPTQIAYDRLRGSVVGLWPAGPDRATFAVLHMPEATIAIEGRGPQQCVTARWAPAPRYHRLHHVQIRWTQTILYSQPVPSSHHLCRFLARIAGSPAAVKTATSRGPSPAFPKWWALDLGRAHLWTPEAYTRPGMDSRFSVVQGHLAAIAKRLASKYGSSAQQQECG